MTADRTIDYYIEFIEAKLSKLKDDNGKNIYGNNSHFGHILIRLSLSPEQQHQAAKRCVQIVVKGMLSGHSAAGVCTKIGETLGYLSGYTPADPPKIAQAGICKMGMEIMHWMAQQGWLTLRKFSIEDSKHFMWHVIPEGEFTNLLMGMDDYVSYPEITNGPVEWVYPVIMHKGSPIELVKRSIASRTLDDHMIDKIPEVYEAVNRANNQGYRVNEHILELVNTATPDNPYMPEMVSQEEFDNAKSEMKKLKFRATNYRKFLLRNVLADSTLPQAQILSIANNKTQEWRIRNGEEALAKVVSSWDKLRTHNKIVTIANDVVGKDLHFIHTFDSRGRLYPVQSYLNTIERDVSKALLCYDIPHNINLYDLAIVTANVIGADKLPLEERVEFVNEHMDTIRILGEAPWDNLELLQSLKVDAKERFQALGLFNVWFKYHIHLENGGVEEDFLTDVRCAYDGTTQGLQLLTLVSRSEFCAPLVNVAPTEHGGPGDAYGFIGQHLSSALDGLEDGKKTPTLVAFNDALKANPKLCRKVVKRPTMTRQYSGTAYGMGKQTFEDRETFGERTEFPEAHNLMYKDAFTIGRVIYNLTEDKFLGPAELMTWLVEGIAGMDKSSSPEFKWTMPDGFVCCCSKGVVTFTSVTHTIGTQKINFGIKVPTGKMNKPKHKSAIAPNVVHSLDAYILREILRNMPADAPISSVHDSFSTSSFYLYTLVDIARQAYKRIGDRDVFKEMMDKAYGYSRSLPAPGKLDINEIDNTNYFIS